MASASKKQSVSRAGDALALPTDFEQDGTYNLPLFQYVTIPKATQRTSPLITSMTCPRGRLERIWLEFPRGCSGLVGIKVLRGEYQIFPLPSGTWFISDNSIFNFKMSIIFQTVPFEVKIYSFNEDDVYTHTPWIGFEFANLDKAPTTNVQRFLDTLKSV